MFTIRRMATVVGLTAAVVTTASVPAWAAYADSATVSTTLVTTTVAAPASVTVDDTCTTATTVVRRTVYTNPGTGEQIQTAYSSTTSYATSSTNVQGTTTNSVPGPGPLEVTTTTTTKNTDLTVTASWTASGSRGVNGYLVKAHLNDGTAYTMAQTAAGTLSASSTADADNLAYQPRLSVTTLTSYGWSTQSALTGYVSC